MRPEITPQWSVQSLERMLSRYPVPLPPEHIRLLPGGFDNLNLLVVTHGCRVVVRRYDVTPEAEVGFELKLVEHLCKCGIPTAPVIPRRDDTLLTKMDGRPAAVFRFVEGEHPKQGDLVVGQRVSEALAQLHVATCNFHSPVFRTRTDSHYLIRLEVALRARMARSPNDRGLTVLANDLAWLRSVLIARFAPFRSALPSGVVHHDPHADNVILNRCGGVAALLDFDTAHAAYLVTDLAALLFYWARDEHTGGLDLASALPLLRAYNRIRPLQGAEWQVLPTAVLRYFAAVAAEYITGRWRHERESTPVLDCWAYEGFRSLRADDAWASALMASAPQ